MKKSQYITILLLIVSIFSGQASLKRYIKPENAGNANGLNWANASNNLQWAINASNAGDTICVSAGTYIGGFTLKDGVQLYGGFNGTERSILDRKYPGTGENLTILDGNKEQRVLSQDTSFNISTVVDGFVIQQGSALAGAGAYIRNNMILRRCIVRDNTAGEIRVGEYIPSQGGVVVRMDKPNGKAYIVAGENFGQTYQSGKGKLAAITTYEKALLDLDGLSNTSQMNNARAATAIKEYRAETPGDVHTDWYIPSAGEWGLLVTGENFTGKRSALCETVEQSLIKNNKQPFGKDKYWSSTSATEGNYPEMWYANFGTMSLNSISSLQYNRLRGMRCFSLNVGSGHGGGVYATSGAQIQGCLIHSNKASEGSGVYSIGNVPVHYSTIIVNNQEVAGFPQSQGLVTFFESGSSEITSVINCIIWGNRDASNAPSNITQTASTRILYTACESAEAVTGTGNLALPEENEADKGVRFKNPAAFDFRLLENSTCAATAEKRRLPKGLDTDLKGTPRSTTNANSMGAFEFELGDGIPKLLSEKAFTIYPNPIYQGGQLTITNGSDYSTFTMILYDLLGRVVFSTVQKETVMQLNMPFQTGSYLLKITTEDGSSITRKIIVR